MATRETQGAWFRPLRLMRIDGRTLPVPDTAANDARFGHSGVSRGERSARPRLRSLALGEVGTRAIAGMETGTYLGFHAWQEARAGGAELLWRVKRHAVFAVEQRLSDGTTLSTMVERPNVRRKGRSGVPVRIIAHALNDSGRPQAEPIDRLATTMLHPEDGPAHELAALYPKRWDIEISVKDVEATRGRRDLVLRCRKPDGVIQGPYGFLNIHDAVRWLLHEAALGQNVDPNRTSFKNGNRAMRRTLSQPERFPPGTGPSSSSEP